MMKRLAMRGLTLLLALLLAVPAMAAEPQIGVIGGADGPTAVTVTGIDGAANTQEEIDTRITAAGGVPGQINVMVDGRCIPFAGALPAIVDGRTLVPLREAMEYLGAKVDYDKTTRTASVTGEDVAFTHVIGSDAITLGDGQRLAMDSASLIQNGNTLVPLRFFSQVLGYDVYWDAPCRTAVVLDRERMIAELDKDFTIFNSYVAKSYEGFDFTAPLSERLTLTGEIKLPEAPKSYPFSGELTLRMDDKALNLDGNLDLGGLMPLYAALSAETGGSGELPAELKALQDVFSPLTFSAILSEQGVYLRSPLVAVILRMTGQEAPKGDFWLAGDDPGWKEILSKYHKMLSDMQPVTLGRVLYASLTMLSNENSTLMYETYTEIAKMYRMLLGDSTWTKRGSDSVWHFGEKELAALVKELTGEDVSLSEAGITKYDLNMTLSEDGSCDIAMEMASEELEMSVTGGSESGRSSQVDFALRVEDTCEVTFRLTAQIETGGEPAAQTPPAGAALFQDL